VSLEFSIAVESAFLVPLPLSSSLFSRKRTNQTVSRFDETTLKPEPHYRRENILKQIKHVAPICIGFEIFIVAETAQFPSASFKKCLKVALM